MSPEAWSKVISAAVVPVVMVSACGLLGLAFYNRLTAVLARLRALQNEALEDQETLLPRPGPGDTQRITRQWTRQMVELLKRQSDQLLHRARLLQRAILALLLAIASLVLSSLASGMSVFAPGLLYAAGFLFVVGQGFILGSVVTAAFELRLALDPVELQHAFVERLSRLLPPDDPDFSAGP